MSALSGRLRTPQAGMSLVEVLVSMTISTLLLGGVMQALLTNQRNAAWSDDIAYIGENGRYALEMLARDTRWAGDWGCAVYNADSTTFANSVDNTGGEDWLSLDGLKGFDGSDESLFPSGLASNSALWSASTDYAGSASHKPDAVIFRGADGANDLTVVTHQEESANFKVSRLHSLTPGDIAVVISEDCSDVGMMQMTGPSGGTNVTFVHNSGEGEPGNCTKMIRWEGGSFDCNDIAKGNAGIDEKLAQPYGPGSRLMGYAAVGYHIGVSAADATQPALYRVQFSTLDDESVTLRSDEIAMGVEDLQILYGVDTDGDLLANAYVRASAIGGGADPVDWDDVVSVRYMLLLRSYGETREGSSAVNLVGYPFAGDSSAYGGHAYNDGYLRQQVSKTVRLRNRSGGAG